MYAQLQVFQQGCLQAVLATYLGQGTSVARLS